MKKYEKNDVKGAIKTFAVSYVLIMWFALYLTDIIGELTDITHGQMVTMRAILCFAVVVLVARFLSINVVKKYQITESYKDNLRFNLNLVIIAIAVVSIFYFLFSLNSNVKEIEEKSEYRFAVSVLGEEAVEEVIGDVKKEARKGFIIIWCAILAGSGIAIYSEGKILDKYCQQDTV